MKFLGKKGFSLMELMVTLGIVTVTTTVAMQVTNSQKVEERSSSVIQTELGLWNLLAYRIRQEKVCVNTLVGKRPGDVITEYKISPTQTLFSVGKVYGERDVELRSIVIDPTNHSLVSTGGTGFITLNITIRRLASVSYLPGQQDRLYSFQIPVVADATNTITACTATPNAVAAVSEEKMCDAIGGTVVGSNCQVLATATPTPGVTWSIDDHTVVAKSYVLEMAGADPGADYLRLDGTNDMEAELTITENLTTDTMRVPAPPAPPAPPTFYDITLKAFTCPPGTLLNKASISGEAAVSTYCTPHKIMCGPNEFLRGLKVDGSPNCIDFPNKSCPLDPITGMPQQIIHVDNDGEVTCGPVNQGSIPKMTCPTGTAMKVNYDNGTHTWSHTCITDTSTNTLDLIGIAACPDIVIRGITERQFPGRVNAAKFEDCYPAYVRAYSKSKTNPTASEKLTASCPSERPDLLSFSCHTDDSSTEHGASRSSSNSPNTVTCQAHHAEPGTLLRAVVLCASSGFMRSDL